MVLTNPLPRVLEARALGGHSVWLRFADRTEGVVDLRQAIDAAPLAALRDESKFAELRVEFGTLVWPGDLDWAPESLYALLIAANGRTSHSTGDASGGHGVQVLAMPEISRFFGIVIRMMYDDHAPPHFHADYGEYAVAVDVQTGEVTGRFPKRALRMVFEWQELHQAELIANWERQQCGLAPFHVTPLE